MTPYSPAVLDAAPHLSRAHAAARAVLGCDHLADDAVQEALVALARTTTSPADLRGWLVRTVVHRARHLRRTLLRRRRHEDHAAQRCDHHPDCDNPLHQACAHELAARLADARAALSGPQRLVFDLHEREGLDYEGLAARLGWPIGTVRSRLHRARATVSRRLASVLDLAARPA